MLIQQALFSQTSLPVLGKSLDASALRAKAIAANLANVATPGYERIEVAFEDALRQALNPKPIRSTGAALNPDPNAMPMVPDLSHVEPVAYRPKDLTQASGVNNVDIDMEMTKLAENQLAFNFGVRFVQERRGAIESAIRGTAG
jgi:flagellar basal-body rod protein FlgB